MPTDFRPYVQQTHPSGGHPGKGVFIEGVKLYVYPAFGYIDVAAIPELGLAYKSQPFGDYFQGMERFAGIWRMMWKEAKKL